jgi:hypothetical protein
LLSSLRQKCQGRRKTSGGKRSRETNDRPALEAEGGTIGLATLPCGRREAEACCELWKERSSGGDAAHDVPVPNIRRTCRTPAKPRRLIRIVFPGGARSNGRWNKSARKPLLWLDSRPATHTTTGRVRRRSRTALPGCHDGLERPPYVEPWLRPGVRCVRGRRAGRPDSMLASRRYFGAFSAFCRSVLARSA